MKINLFLILLFNFYTVVMLGQSRSDKFETIEIQTSAQCEMCKHKLESHLAFEKGIRDVNLDLETKVLTVKFKLVKTDPDKIRDAISLIGYDADQVPADPKAYENLADCCKKGGHP